jgi:hypothetical protein
MQRCWIWLINKCHKNASQFISAGDANVIAGLVLNEHGFKQPNDFVLIHILVKKFQFSFFRMFYLTELVVPGNGLPTSVSIFLPSTGILYISIRFHPIL